MAHPSTLWPRWLALFGLSTFTAMVNGLNYPATEDIPYRKGDLVPVTCLNRTIETGEHITDSSGTLQYIPFPTCTETNLPLALPYHSSTSPSHPLNCTVTISDPFFHLLEFYIHNDAPMTCRIPAHSPSMSSKKAAIDKISADAKDNAVLGLGVEKSGFVPLTVALAGTLQRSHLHVSNWLNVVVHTEPLSASSSNKDKAARRRAAGKQEQQQEQQPGAIHSATAYSVHPATRNTRVIIGDDLTFVFSVRWYDGATLPLGQTARSGGRNSFVFVACVFSAAVGAGLVYVWLRGVDVPRGMRVGGVERIGRREIGLPKYNGYGYGIGQMNGEGGMGKRD